MNSYLAKYFHNYVQKIRGWDFQSALDELEKNQWQPPELIQKKRFALLKELLLFSQQNNVFYQELWRSIGFHPQDIIKEKDIKQLPVISKDDLHAHYSSILSKKAPPYEIWKSSGSTGKPFPFYLDKNSIIYNTFGSLTRGRRWWGFEYGIPECMIWSGVSDVSGTFSGKINALRRRLSWRMKNILLIDVYTLNVQNAEKGYNALIQHKPKLIRAIASGLFRFCSYLEELGLDCKRIGLKGVIYTGEGLTDNQRTFIENTLHCPTICEYGCAELGAIGFECPEGSIHLSHDNYFLEFLNNGQDAQPGETAELVVTNLRNLSSPLIRYATGDLVVLSACKKCACGRSLPVIESVLGRVHDKILTPDGTVLHGLFFTHLFDDIDEVHQFRVIQEDINHLIIELVSPETIDNSIMLSIKNKVDKQFAEQDVVSVKQVPSLPVSQGGKTPWIISKISQ